MNINERQVEKECGVEIITLSENGPEIFLEYQDMEGRECQASVEVNGGDPIEAIKSAIA